MTNKRIFNLIAGLFLLVGFTACEYDWVEPEVIVVPDVVSFNGDVIPVFDKSCNMSGCHAQGSTSPDLSSANAWDDLMAKGLINTETPAQSELYISVTTGSMKKFSNAANNAIILKWIEQGALNN
ncbi:MAG TPA: hypothetical protein DCR43_04465 [Bacteroidales bacterium]|nr:MAG: hypothetical protein A2X11_01045 [Bacteroidetes bacterium GWE2_42_24]OFY27456.1 MAG: hypothetical protein A2X09_07180 [Bacteroidetes bacterium GWF2_43_11]HAQ65093.1 hypothetical protein [Bacteroidales bacterium]HBZ65970.1 hypothetical protein [Bacteroidales bacterium]